MFKKLYLIAEISLKLINVKQIIAIEFNQLNYLILHNCINYSNSANLLFTNIPAGKKSKIKTLAFAPIYKEGETIEIAQKKYKTDMSNIDSMKKKLYEIKMLTADNVTGFMVNHQKKPFKGANRVGVFLLKKI